MTTVTVTLYLKIHVWMNLDTTAEAEMLLSSVTSSPLVIPSIIVSR